MTPEKCLYRLHMRGFSEDLDHVIRQIPLLLQEVKFMLSSLNKPFKHSSFNHE